MDVAATILPLVGVALGTAGTLTGQYLATRGEAQRHVERRTAEARAECKEAIVGFLGAAQRLEQVVDDRRRGQPPPPSLDDLLHELWLAKKVLELVCGHELASAAHRYTSGLHAAAEGEEAPAGAPKRERGDFMEAARRELGIDGPRLYKP
jgi:hypothetical protein